MLGGLKNPEIQGLAVEPREGLLRLGLESVEAARAVPGRRIRVGEAEEIQDDRGRDLAEVLVSMGARRYGKRGARNRASPAMEAMGGQ